MIVNFRVHKNNQGVHKLIQISILKKKKKKTELLRPCIDRSLTTFPSNPWSSLSVKPIPSTSKLFFLQYYKIIHGDGDDVRSPVENPILLFGIALRYQQLPHRSSKKLTGDVPWLPHEE
jgi:hypothetical protein